MATKAETFKSETQRAAHGVGAKARKLARDQASKKPNPAREGLPHNTAARAGKNSPYEFEVSATRPSRKSTRRSPTHLKTDATMRLTATERTTAPRARAARK